MSLILWLFTSILDTLKSIPTVVLFSSSSKSCSSDKYRNKLLFPTLELPIKSSFISTKASEEFVLIFSCDIMIVDKNMTEIAGVASVKVI